MRGRDALAPNPAIWGLCGIVAASVVLRVGAALYLGINVTVQPGTADQLSYHQLALRVLGGHGFSFETGWWPATPAGEPTAHWSYAYVLFLAGVYAVTGPVPLVARIVQAVAAGILQPLLTFKIARRLFGTRVALVSGAIVAGYAYFIYYGGALMTESFFIVSLLWTLDTAMRLGRSESPGTRGTASWLRLGFGIATTILLRQAFLVCVPVILGWVGWRHLSRVKRAPAAEGIGPLVRGVGLVLLVVGLSIAPWTMRNYRAFHQFVLLNTNAGFAFYWGNHPIHGSSFIPILPGDGSLYGKILPEDLRGRNEAEFDRELLRRGLGYVADDPVRYVRLSISRLREFVKFWPSSDSDRMSNAARVASFGVWLPFILVGLGIVVHAQANQDVSPDVWLLLGVAVVYSLAHVLTWTLVRYRLPVDALLIPMAGLAAVRLFDRLARPTAAASGIVTG